MSEYDDLELNEEDLARLRPEPEPVVVVEETGVSQIEAKQTRGFAGAVDVETMEPTAQGPPVDESWHPLRVALPLVGAKQKVALAVLWEELKDGRWRWKVELAETVALQTEMERTSMLRMLKKLAEGGALERREPKVGVVEVRLRPVN